jgi:hypothetical protein
MYVQTNQEILEFFTKQWLDQGRKSGQFNIDWKQGFN